MRKILIILFSLFCLNLGAFAVGVDCWEEYTTSNKTEPTTSALRTALTNAGATPILVSQIYDLTILTSRFCSSGICTSPSFVSSKIPFEFVQLISLNGTSYLPYTHSYYFRNASSSSGRTDNTTFDYSVYTNVYGYSIYTYCVVNNNSSSSGSSSTGSVNFIIKATS